MSSSARRELVPAQRLERDAVHARVALDLGQQRAQRVAAVELVEAVGQDDEHPLAAERAGEEGDERTGGGVRPVQVLEGEHDGRVGAEAVEEAEDGLEESALRRAVGRRRVARRRRAGQPREEAGQLGAVARMQRVEGGMTVAGEPAQRRDERGVGQLALAELDRVAAEHLGAGRFGPAQELADEPGLPDAGVTRHEGERRAARGGGRQRVLELLQLGRAADHPAARHARRHGTSMPRGGRLGRGLEAAGRGERRG